MGILCFTLGHITIKTWVAGAWKIAWIITKRKCSTMFLLVIPIFFSWKQKSLTFRWIDRKRQLYVKFLRTTNTAPYNMTQNLVYGRSGWRPWTSASAHSHASALTVLSRRSPTDGVLSKTAGFRSFQIHHDVSMINDKVSLCSWRGEAHTTSDHQSVKSSSTMILILSPVPHQWPVFELKTTRKWLLKWLGWPTCWPSCNNSDVFLCQGEPMQVGLRR
jgi:hypothetical protein